MFCCSQYFFLFAASDAIDYSIYDARIIVLIKNEGTPHTFIKSRYVIITFNDKKHGLLTITSVVQRLSQDLILALFESHPYFLLSRQIYYRPILC